MANDLDVLDPTGRDVTVAGRTLTILPLTIGQLPRFVRAIQPAAPLFGGSQDLDWVALIAQHGEALIEAAAVATAIDSKEIETLAPDEFALLCGAVFEANVDFFVRRLGPALERVSDRILAATETITGTGPIPSKPS